jgi:hypothetical protein
MSTLEIRAPRAAKTFSPAGFARFFSVVLMVMEVLAEAQRLAHQAQRRYPFAVE